MSEINDQVVKSIFLREDPSEVSAILDNQQMSIPLDVEASSEATTMSKTLYGENGPVVNTYEDLQDANEYEAERVDNENAYSIIQKNVQDAAQGKEGSAALTSKELEKAAWDRLLHERFGSAEGLAHSSLRQEQADALLSEPSLQANSLNEVDAYLRGVQEKYTIFTTHADRWAKEVSNQSMWKSVKHFGKSLVPGRASLVDLAGSFDPEGSLLTPLKNKEKTKELLHSAVINDKISAVELDAFLNAYDDTLVNKFGLDANDMMEIYKNMSKLPDIWDKVFAYVDVGSLVAPGVSGVSGGVKGAISGGVKGALAGTAKGFAVGAVESFAPLKKTNMPLRKVVSGVKDSISRKKFVGNVSEATEELSKIISKEARPEAIMSKELRAQVFNHALPDAVKGAESVDKSISSASKIVSSKIYKSYVNSLHAGSASEEVLRGGRIGSLVRELSTTFIDDLTATVQNTTRLSDLGLGELIKAVPADELLRTKGGELVARIRYPKAFATKEKADEFLKSVFPIMDAEADDPVIGGFVSTVRTEKGVDTTGQYFVDIDLTTHSGLGMMFSKSDKSSWKGHFESAFFTTTSKPSMIRQLDFLKDVQENALRDTFRAASKSVKTLNKNEKFLFDTLFEKSVQQHAYFTPEQILQLTKNNTIKGINSDKIADAYSKVRATEDIQAYEMNYARRLQMTQAGIKSLTLNDKDIGYGRVLRVTPENILSSFMKEDVAIVLDSLDAEPITFKRLMELDSQEAAARVQAIETALREKDYVAFTRDYDLRFNRKSSNVYYLIPGNTLVENPLPEIVSHYLPGFHRYFDRSAGFVKQYRIATGTDGKEYIRGVRTFATDTNLFALNDSWKKIEELRKMVVNKKGAAEITAEIQKMNIPFAPFKDHRDLILFFANEGVDTLRLENSLEVVGNNMPLKSFNKLLNTDRFVDLVGDKNWGEILSSSGFEAMQEAAINAQKIRSGVDILSGSFELAKTVDVETMLNYSVQDLINFGLMNDYTDLYANKFVNDFGDLINELKMPFKSARDALINADFKSFLESADISKRKAASAAITAQKNYAMIRGIPSELDKKVSQAAVSLLQHLQASEDALNLPHTLSNGLRVSFDTITKLKPIQKLTTLAVHTWLGLLRPAQLLKNFIGPASLIITAKPTAGAKAFAMIHPLQNLLIGGEDAVNIVKRYCKLSRLPYDEVYSTYQAIKKLGVTTPGTYGGLLEGVSKEGVLSKTSLYFFNKADTWNRIMAAATAAIDRGYNLKELKSAADIAAVGSDFQSLYLNMGRQGMSRIQSVNVARPFFQFMGYTLHNLETMLRDTNLTPAERTRMALFTLGATGVAGFTGHGIYNALSNSFDIPTGYEDDTLKGYLEEGIRSGGLGILSKYLDIDLDFSSYLAPQYFDLIENFMDLSPLGLFQDAAPGAKAATNLLDVLGDIVGWMYNNTLGSGTYADFSSLLSRHIEKGNLGSSARELQSFYTLWTEGVKYNSKGELSLEDNRKLAAFGALAGFSQKTPSMLHKARKKEEKIKDAASELYNSVVEDYNYGVRNNDLLVLDEVQYKINSSGLPPVVQLNVIKRLNRQSLAAGHITPFERAAEDYAKKMLTYQEDLLK